MKISKRRSFGWLVLAAIVAALAVAAAGCGGGEEAAPPAEEPPAATTEAPPATTEEAPPATTEAPPAEPGLGSAFDVASAGDVTLTLWWLGDLEAPGVEKWMDETVGLFEAKYPNVNVETTLYDTNTWVQTQQTSCQSKSGPDIWYNWAGTWPLEPAWKGCTVPNEAVLSPEDIAHNPAVQETSWQGQTWVYPLGWFVYPIAINKELFTKAGLDAENPPATWDEWIAALDKLKSAGITPLAMGLKDGFDGEIVASGQLEKQWVSQPQDIMQLVIDGDITTNAGWTLWLSKLFELKPYFNDDANSLTFAEGLALWQNGKTAMVFGAPGMQSVITAAVDSGMSVGLMKMPAFGEGTWADSLVRTSQGYQVTQWSENKEVAGAFLAFMHEPDRLTAYYAATGNFPADDRWDSSVATSPTDQQMLAWLAEKGDAFWAANYTPIDVDVNCRFVIFQKMMAGEIDAAGAAKICQDVLAKWRAANPDALANFQSWLG